MNPLHAVLRRAITDLHAIKVRFALVGGMAVSARSEPRFTHDVDLALAVASDREADEIGHSMIGRRYRPLAQIEDEGLDRFATLRLVPPPIPGVDDAPILDLIFACTGIESEIVAASTPIEIAPGLRVPTAHIEHLLAMKILSYSDRRIKDQQDIVTLLKAASPNQVAEARRLLNLMTQRGHHRDRDLMQRLDHWIKVLASDD